MSEPGVPLGGPTWPQEGPPADLPGPAGPAGPRADQPIVLVPLSRRFCPRCGARWDPSWADCPHCPAAAARTAAPQPATAIDEVPQGSLSTALSLYFTLLGFSALGLILVKTGAAGEAHVEIVISLAFAAIAAVWAAKTSRVVRPALARSGRLLWYPAAVGLGCATFAVAWLAVRFLVQVLGVSDPAYSRPFLAAGHGWGTVLLVIAVQPAVVEELAFRGVILGVLRGVLGVRDAVIVSALLFMVLHLAVLSFPHLLLVGLVLAYLRLRSGSLYPCMVMHFAHNFLVLLAEMKGF